MARSFYGDPSTRTNGQCKRRGWDTEMFGGPQASVCTHHTRWSRRGRTAYAWFGLLWPDTSMATQLRARMASASGVVAIQRCCTDPRRRFPRTTPGGRVLDARTTRSADFYGQIPLWPPKYALEGPLQAPWLGCRNVGGPSASVCTNHTRWTRREGTPHACFRLLWPDTSMATQVSARMARASGAFEVKKCWGHPRRRFAATTPGRRVVDAHRTRGLDFYGQILLWPPKYAHEWPVQAAWLGYRNVRGTPGVGLHPPHPVVASWTHSVRVVWTSMARYFYGHPTTRTNGQCKRRGCDTEMLHGPPAAVSTHHTRWSRPGRTHDPVCGLLWPDTSLATQVRARRAAASAVVGMQKCWGTLGVGLHQPHPVDAS